MTWKELLLTKAPAPGAPATALPTGSDEPTNEQVSSSNNEQVTTAATTPPTTATQAPAPAPSLPGPSSTSAFFPVAPPPPPSTTTSTSTTVTPFRVRSRSPSPIRAQIIRSRSNSPSFFFPKLPPSPRSQTQKTTAKSNASASTNVNSNASVDSTSNSLPSFGSSSKDVVSFKTIPKPTPPSTPPPPSSVSSNAKIVSTSTSMTPSTTTTTTATGSIHSNYYSNTTENTLPKKKETWTPPLSPSMKMNGTISSASSVGTSTSGTTKKRDYSHSPWHLDLTLPQTKEEGAQPILSSPAKTSHGTRSWFGTHSILEKKEVRLHYAAQFAAGIDQLHDERTHDLSLKYIVVSHDNSDNNNKNQNVKVFVRKRCLLPAEQETGDFDVVRLEEAGGVDGSCHSKSRVVVYQTDIQSDTKRIEPAIFASDAAFDDSKALALYHTTTKPLVDMAKSGGVATLLLYGPPGSGKSYTLSALESMMARDIFTGLPNNFAVRIHLVELCGTYCTDLLDESIGGTSSSSSVRIVDSHREDVGGGTVRFVNATSRVVFAPEELLEAIVTAKRRRNEQLQSQSDQPHHVDGLSRHIVCRITVVPPPNAPACIRQGTLTLVEAAAAVRAVQRRSNTKTNGQMAIDASLWALNQCLLAKTKGSLADNNCKSSNGDTNATIPYNHSNLTRILRESMEREGASCHILVTISPKATDTEATMATLCTVSTLIAGYNSISAADRTWNNASNDQKEVANNPAKAVLRHPRAWNHDELCEWMVRKHLISDAATIPKKLNGRDVMRMTKAELQTTFYPTRDDKVRKADLLYRCLRAETDRIALIEVKKQMAAKRSQVKAS